MWYLVKRVRNRGAEMKKNILLIMPNFFNYPQAISKELEKMGYEVDCFDDRPSTNGFVKAVIRVNKDLIRWYIKIYFEQMMKTVRSKKYDVVLLISGQSLSFSEEMILQIKREQSQAKYVLYQWDSLENFPYIKKIEPLFDCCYSFDRDDVRNNINLKFLPLFYTRQYEKVGTQERYEFQYDFCFIGTAHPKKYKLINMMSAQLKEQYPKQYIYFYFPSRLVYFYRKVVNQEMRHSHYNEFHYVPLRNDEMNHIYENSLCVLDSAQDGQRGLTIRVIEALGAKKKLITTNKDVVNYDFYRPENIYIYEGYIDLNNIFFKEAYREVDEEIYHKYSLRSWLKEILREDC